MKRLFGLMLAAAAVGIVYYASTKEAPLKGVAGGFGKRAEGKGGANADFPSPVLVGEAKIADVPVLLEGVGSVKALNTTTVKALVEGKILKFNFSEGQFVKKGDVLAEIDAAPYQAAYDQSVAKKQVNETLLFNAARDYERYGKVSAGVVSQKTIDTQEALVRQLTAQVAADTAAVAAARTTLDYTRVTAPISGRTGIRQVDEGNVVRSADPNGIVVLTQLQPLTILFTLPQQQLSQIAKAMAAGAVRAEAVDGDNKGILDTGVVTVVDNQVDQTTGTVKVKAEFPNTKLQLWPGQFVNVRILVETLKQVVVAPTPAIQRGPNGIYVFVVPPGASTVSQRAVSTGLQNDRESVILTGLQPGERVVTTGFGRLQDGARIVISPRGDGGNAPGGQKRDGGAPPDASAPAAAAPTGGAQAAEPPKGEWKRGEGKGEGRGEGKRRRDGELGSKQGTSP